MIGDLLSHIESNNDLTTFRILVEGKEVQELYPLMRFNIRFELNKIPKASLVFYDGDIANESLDISSSRHFEPGNRVEIKVGYHSDENLLFTGKITEQKISGKANECTYLNIECRGEAYLMTLKRDNGSYKAQSEKSLFDEILNKYGGLAADVNIDGDFESEVPQNRVSDWDFLIGRAEKIGAYFFFDAKDKLSIKSPDLNAIGDIKLKLGQDIYDFSFEQDAKNQFSEVNIVGWDDVKQAIAKSSITNKEGLDLVGQSNRDGNNVTGGQSLELRNSGISNKREQELLTKAQMLKINLSKTQGTLKCEGRPDIYLGMMITLVGFGDRFSGDKVFVSGIAHVLEKGTWKTHVHIGLSEQWHHEQYDIQPSPSSGLNTAIHGLQIGKVIDIVGEDKNAQRIFVNLPITDADKSTGIWARLATLDAGDQRGTFFRPEKDDEVIVGFINSDPNQAVILGQLHSEKHKPPVETEETNAQKGFVSRSELKIIFDDENKSILIETPAGNKVFLDESSKSIVIEDEHNNIITMEKKGIQLESKKDITISAKSGKISMEAMNIDIKASANLTASASAAATFEGKTNAALKGQIVMIN